MNTSKNKKGFTLIELVISFSLSIIVVVYVFNLILLIKDLYITKGIKTQLLIKQTEIVSLIEDKLLEKEVVTISTVGEDVLIIQYNDMTTSFLTFNKEENYIEFDNKRFYFEKGIIIGDLTFTSDTLVEKQKDKSYNTILAFRLPITSNYVDGDYGINIIHPYNFCGNSNDPFVIEDGNCKIDFEELPMLKKEVVSPNSSSSFLGTSIIRENIETVNVVNVGTFPVGAIDVSEQNDESVKLWTKDTNGNGKLEVYIGAVNSKVYANPDSSYLFSSIVNATKIDLGGFDTRFTTNMNSIFRVIGQYSSSFSINLGNDFNTELVIDMGSMFEAVCRNCSTVVLDLKNKFDTSNVKNMSYMFSRLGEVGISTIKLGDKFNTNNVENMSYMFSYLPKTNSNFTLGDKFDTSKVTNMSYMFYEMGSSDANFVLDLGEKFDTKNVTNMSSMFRLTGRINPNFSLDLGKKFNVSKVTSLADAFAGTGSSNLSFKPNATVKTQAEKNAILTKFPNINIIVAP